MIIERKHYFIGAFILAFALVAQPFSVVFIQTALTPKLVEVLEKMKVNPLEEFYSAAGLDEEKLAMCQEDSATAKIVNDDQALGESLGVTGTPSTFIGRPDGKGNIVLYKENISGALPLAAVQEAINKSNKVLSGALIKSENLHIYGNKNAEVFLVEFSDLECPFCASFEPTAKSMVDNSNGKIALVYKHFPLYTIHKNAIQLAITSECIGQQKGDIGFFSFVEQNFKALSSK